MADDTQQPTTEPTVAPAADPAPLPVSTPDPAAAAQDPAVQQAQQSQDPSQLVSDFKKDELQSAAAVVGAEVPSSATKADLAEAIVSQQAPAQPVVVDLNTKRTDDDPILGAWVDVVSGEYQGRFGAYVATVSHDKDSGYPERVIIRTRDADNMLVEVDYSELRPSERNGGR